MKADSNVETYGVRTRTSVTNEIEACSEEIVRNGFSYLTDVFSSEEMNRARARIDAIYATQAAECGGIDELGDDRDVVRCPLAYDPFLLEIACNERVLDVIRAILGPSFVLVMQNSIINRADSPQYQVKWHRDLTYQHWTSTQPIALNFLVCVDDFFPEGGSTWVLPASHKCADFPSDAYVRKFERPVELKSGSVVVLDAMTYHRAGLNVIPGYVRRAINHVVGLPFIGQQIDIPQMLGDHGFDRSGDPLLAPYLGYRWNPAKSPAAWRSLRRPALRQN